MARAAHGREARDAGGPERHRGHHADVLCAPVAQPHGREAAGRGRVPGASARVYDASRRGRGDGGRGDEARAEAQGVAARAHRGGTHTGGRGRPEGGGGAGHELAPGAGGVTVSERKRKSVRRR